MNTLVHCTMWQCATESINDYGIGYFVLNTNPFCRLGVDACEVVNRCAGNPGADTNRGVTGVITIWSQGPTRVANCIVQSAGSVGTPAIGGFANGSCLIENCTWVIPDSVNPAAQTQIPVFDTGFNDLTRSLFGRTNYGQHVPHNVWLRGNNALVNGTITQMLQDLVGSTFEIHHCGPLTNNTDPTATETYRAQPRVTTSCYDVDYSQVRSTGGLVYLCLLQDRTRVRSVVVECTQTFDPATTIDVGTEKGGYNDILNNVAVPAAGNPITSGVDVPQSVLAHTWVMLGYIKVAVNFRNAVTAGHLKVYVTTEVFA
jgi:hypothetical protein